jgi:hypothetical protein
MVRQEVLLTSRTSSRNHSRDRFVLNLLFISTFTFAMHFKFVSYRSENSKRVENLNSLQLLEVYEHNVIALV